MKNYSVSLQRRFRGAGAGVLLASCCIFLTTGAQAAVAKQVKVLSATASSTLDKYAASKAIDNTVSDASRWVSEGNKLPAWLELKLNEPTTVGGLHLYSGYGNTDPLEDFSVCFWSQNEWKEIPSAVVSGNKSVALRLPFDQTVEVKTDRLRINIAQSPRGTARIKEVYVWSGDGDIPALATKQAQAKESHGNTVSQQDNIVPILLNQSGFNLGAPKRFTAPTVKDGTSFSIRMTTDKKQGTGDVLFSGALKGQIGDFSPFNPLEDRDYVVECGGLTSVPFRIGYWWLERVTYQNAVNFMVDARHHVGNERAVCRGSFGWRDDHHFGWELNTLVPQYLSNPSAYDRMPRQIKYEKPQDPKLWGKLEPYRDDIPDQIKLIHWGADVIVTQGLKHEFLKGSLAYFLYAWDLCLKDFLPRQNYEVVKEYAFSVWALEAADRNYPYDTCKEHNLFALKIGVGTTKGERPAGYTIEPNLMMYEIAKRENRPDANKYLEAATRQVEWIVKELDWNDPQVTKGQRMSEFITMTGLVFYLRNAPQGASAGIQSKINAWAEVIISRSDNLWDFRKLCGKTEWTPMGEKPQMWNEVGNITGLPAAIFSMLDLIQEPARKQRLEQVAWACFDNMFGRNPTGRHFSNTASKEIEGVEHDWYSRHPGGIGRLEKARFVLDGCPKDPLFPYSPEKGNIGWTEGWIQFNTPFNLSLAYLAAHGTSIELKREGDHCVILLTAPLNFDYQKVEAGTVVVTRSNGVQDRVTVTEVSPNAPVLRASVPCKAGEKLKVSYGYGYWGHEVTL
jgi:hypothetical protein